MNTKHTNQIVPALLAAGFLMAACGTASAQSVLLSDSFNNGGVNGQHVDDYNGSGQAGSLAPIGYISKGNYQSINNNQVVFSSGYESVGRLVINHDFATDSAITTSGGFTISYNYFVPASSDNWLGIMFGETSTFVNSDLEPRMQIVNSATPFGIILRGSGGYQSFTDGAGIAGSTPLTLNTGTTANQVVLTVLTTSFASGSSATVSATVNGTAIDLGADANFTWGAGGENYIQFEDYQNNGFGMNDLAIVAVPEPSTAVLAGLGAALLIIRRRKA